MNSTTVKTVANVNAAREYIERREAFRTRGSFHADTYANPWNTGRMPRVWADIFRTDASDIDYVVYSYATPIAWHTAEGWTVPDVYYSSTTATKHRPQLSAPYGTRRTRPLSEALTVVSARRLNSSVNGNPAFEVTFSDGRIARTSSDAAVGYDVENEVRAHNPLFVTFTPAGRVSHWTAVRNNGFQS